MWLAGAAIAAALALVGLQQYIAWEARWTGDRARAQFGGDRVTALARVVDCEARGLRQRDRAVWALGELKDERALPVLRSYYRGGKCDHARELCQYELDKAMRKISGTWGALPLPARLGLR
jgi:hypothetical protein